MAYSYFSAAVPDPATEAIVTAFSDIRKNFEAIRDGVVVTFPLGWDFLPQGTNLEQPTSIIAFRGSERLVTKMVWGTVGGEEDNVTQARFTYSSDAGSSYTSMGHYDVSYNASGIVTGVSYTTG